MSKPWVPAELLISHTEVRKIKTFNKVRNFNETLDSKIDSLALKTFEQHAKLTTEGDMSWLRAREEAVELAIADSVIVADEIFPIISARIASEMDPTNLSSYSDLQKGLLLLATCSSAIFKYKTKQLNSEFNKLVPRFLVGYKKFNNSEYSNMPLTAFTLGTDLFELVTCDLELYNSITKEQAVELRKTCLSTTRSPGSPQTSYSIYRTKGTPLEHLPTLARITVLQTWAAHPTNRTKYMILDPNDVDNMPEPILDGVIQKHSFEKTVDTPW